VEYPDSVYALDRAPHDWLFPRMAGVIHHGGAGTLAAGLRAGVPTVIKPFFGDQVLEFNKVLLGRACTRPQSRRIYSYTVSKLTNVRIRDN
jgi:UDP-glucoronosyl and UDP-glucosyl transferase